MGGWCDTSFQVRCYNQGVDYRMAHIPIGKRPMAWIDTETTGLNPAVHEVIDVAVVFDLDVASSLRIPHLTIPEGADYAFFSARIKPERLGVAEPTALRVNGYTPEAWANAHDAATVVQVLQVILKDVVLVGHNVAFDKGFIESMIQRTGSQFRFGHHAIDTVTLAIEHLVCVGAESVSLDHICPILGISNANNHTALADALRCRAAYRALIRAGDLERLRWKSEIERLRNLQ